MKHADQVIEELKRAGRPEPERKGGFFKCPHCTLVNDDIDEMADHIRHACDLAYNDTLRKEK